MIYSGFIMPHYERSLPLSIFRFHKRHSYCTCVKIRHSSPLRATVRHEFFANRLTIKEKFTKTLDLIPAITLIITP